MKRYFLLVIILVASLSVRIYSQPEGERFLSRAIDKLNLSDQQKEDVEKIHFDMQKQTIVQKAKLAIARVEFQQLLNAETLDKTAIEKKLSEMADLGVQLHMVKINSWFAVNKLLTLEQQKSWKRVLEKGPALFRDHVMSGMKERHIETWPDRSMPD